MNPERWEEITKSFGLVVVEQYAGTTVSPVEQLTSNEEIYITQSRKHEGKVEKQNLPEYQTFSKSESNFLTDADDAQGKIIENLCKTVRDKAEKIKIQEQEICLLNERLQRKTCKDGVAQTVADVNIDDVLNEPRQTDSRIDTCLRKIALKVDNLERRLTTLVNFVQRKFPKEIGNSTEFCKEKKKQNMERLVSRAWDKPPVFYPKPTYGSIMREIHCRSRFNNDVNDREMPFDNGSLSYRPNTISTTPKVLKEDEMEMRVQALERLVILLKSKMMKKINSRRK